MKSWEGILNNCVGALAEVLIDRPLGKADWDVIYAAK